MDPQVSTQTRKFFKKHHILILVLTVIAVLAIATSFYFYNNYMALKKNPNLEVQKQTQELVAKVSKLMELPTDETPTVATVTDVNKLKDQVFFKGAANGDQVLIYVKARKAILYDPVKNIIVDVAPINIAQVPTLAPSAKVSPAPSEAVQKAATTPMPTTAPTK